MTARSKSDTHKGHSIVSYVYNLQQSDLPWQVEYISDFDKILVKYKYTLECAL